MSGYLLDSSSSSSGDASNDELLLQLREPPAYEDVYASSKSEAAAPRADVLLRRQAVAELERAPCMCAGSFDDREHCVFVAFLHYDNDEYREEQCLQDYRLLPMNRLTALLSGSDIYHCQVFYWDHRRRAFVTISVDTYHNCVHEYDKKTFRRGWSFLRLKLPKWRENGIISFLRAQIGKPMNVYGAYRLFLLPYSGGGESFFCSELCLAALQHVGLLLSLSPAGTSPGALYRAICESGEFDYSESSHPLVMLSNREFWERERQQFLEDQAHARAAREARRKQQKMLQAVGRRRRKQRQVRPEPGFSSSASDDDDDDDDDDDSMVRGLYI